MKTRRDFIKTGLVLGAASYALSHGTDLFAAEAGAATVSTSSEGKPVLVAVMNGSRSEMLDKALGELGGIEAFVKPGQRVVIKPNIGWNTPPERAADTHPELIGKLVALCVAAGAKSVDVFDYTCNPWRECYTRSGIEEAVQKAGGSMKPGNDEQYYKEVAIPNGKVLKSAKVHELVLQSDVLLNVPVLKHHSGSIVSGAMKNLMGVIWDRRFYHTADLHQCIADFLTFKKPALNIMDAYHPMYRNGPRGKTVEDTVEKKMLFASTDIVALDTAGAKVLDQNPSTVRHIEMAAQLGVGTMDLSKVDLRRFKLA